MINLELVEPDLLGRCSWETQEARRDVEVLAWIGRFRFVTAEAIGERFGVSWQRANARVRRLERLALVGCAREHVSQPRAVFLTGRGHELLGQPRRRAPRAQVQRDHEAAIVWLVTQLEREADGAVRVLTERECRGLEFSGNGLRYSITLDDGARRWADVVVEYGGRRRAIEIEFAPKGTRRLAQIVAAYQLSEYDDVFFFVRNAALGRRIGALTYGPRVHVLAWPDLPEHERKRLTRAFTATERTEVPANTDAPRRARSLRDPLPRAAAIPQSQRPRAAGARSRARA